MAPRSSISPIPAGPTEFAWFIPEAGSGGTAPQSNDVVLDERGLVIVTDRISGLDILELAV